MSYKLLVLTFDGQRAAEAALHELQGMEAAGRLTLEDSVLVTTGLDQDLELKQVSPEAGGRCRARLAPLMFGGAMPGRVARTTIESLTLSLKGHGVDDAFLDELAGHLQPGSAALFLLGVAHETDRMLRKAEAYGAKILQTTLLREWVHRLLPPYDNCRIIRGGAAEGPGPRPAASGATNHPKEPTMDREEMLCLLSELIACHSPAGEEGEIDAVLRRELQATKAEVWQDGTSNLIARLPGPGPRVMICAHKDEIGMIVTAVRDDGRLEVQNCGGARPWKYGEGPVDVIADDGHAVRGVLSVGSVHTKTGPVAELDTKRPLTWDLVTIFTGLEPAQLEEEGIHVGSRAVVARERKEIQRLGDYIASFALDDRMGLVALVAGLRAMSLEENRTAGTQPDLYFVAAHGEEVGMLGAMRAARRIEPEVCIALDTSPVAHGTPLVVDARPVVWYGERAYHNKTECDRLLGLARELGFGAQACVYAASGSDAGRIKQAGLAERTVCFGFARDNSHGFEIAHVDSLANVTRLLVAYLWQLD